MTKKHLDLIYTQNEEGCFNHIMERLSWYNTNEISIQCLRAPPNRDGLFKNDVFIEAVRYILGLPCHILQPFADGHHFIGHRTHAGIRSRIIVMFKKAKIWAIREPQNIFHGHVLADILKQYCDQHSIKEFIISYK